MLKYQLSQIKLEGVSPVTKQPKFTLNLAIKVTFVTAIFGFLFAGIMIYSMFGVYSVLSKGRPAPWPWWWFKSSMRLVELAMCVTMSYVATQPFRYSNDVRSVSRKWNCNHVMFYFPCRRLCQCNERELSDDGLHWLDHQESFMDPSHPVPNDLGGYGMSQVMVEEAIPITVRMVDCHAAGTGCSGSTSCSGGGSGCTADGSCSRLGTSGSGRSASRPTSLLVTENGLVRSVSIPVDCEPLCGLADHCTRA